MSNDDVKWPLRVPLHSLLRQTYRVLHLHLLCPLQSPRYWLSQSEWRPHLEACGRCNMQVRGLTFS
jgi:hypothetical protein